MQTPVVIIGLGEMGGVFARGILRSGRPVFPLVRGMDMNTAAGEFPQPELVLVAVAESDIHEVLKKIPEAWRDRLGLLQNELLPRDWQAHDVNDPTVISVWFEKKKGQDARVIIPSPVFGPAASLIKQALGCIDIPVNILDSTEHLEYELVRKNVYILTTNIAGLRTGGTVGELWEQHRDFARQVASEVIAVQEVLTGSAQPQERLIAGMIEAFEGDLEHKCMGRSAPARLGRALAQADAAGLKVPVLKDIWKNYCS
jgi:ketopantoate reductase